MLFWVTCLLKIDRHGGQCNYLIDLLCFQIFAYGVRFFFFSDKIFIIQNFFLTSWSGGNLGRRRRQVGTEAGACWVDEAEARRGGCVKSSGRALQVWLFKCDAYERQGRDSGKVAVFCF